MKILIVNYFKDGRYQLENGLKEHYLNAIMNLFPQRFL